MVVAKLVLAGCGWMGTTPSKKSKRGRGKRSARPLGKRAKRRAARRAAERKAETATRKARRAFEAMAAEGLGISVADLGGILAVRPSLLLPRDYFPQVDENAELLCSVDPGSARLSPSGRQKRKSRISAGFSTKGQQG